MYYIMYVIFASLMQFSAYICKVRYIWAQRWVALFKRVLKPEIKVLNIFQQVKKLYFRRQLLTSQPCLISSNSLSLMIFQCQKECLQKVPRSSYSFQRIMIRSEAILMDWHLHTTQGFSEEMWAIAILAFAPVSYASSWDYHDPSFLRTSLRFWH